MEERGSDGSPTPATPTISADPSSFDFYISSGTLGATVGTGDTEVGNLCLEIAGGFMWTPRTVAEDE